MNTVVIALRTREQTTFKHPKQRDHANGLCGVGTRKLKDPELADRIGELKLAARRLADCGDRNHYAILQVAWRDQLGYLYAHPRGHLNGRSRRIVETVLERAVLLNSVSW